MNAYCGKEVNNRLLSIEGHIRGIRQMIEDDKPCEDVLLQLSAVEAAISKAAKILLKNHFDHCVKEGVENGDYGILERFSKIIDKYV